MKYAPLATLCLAVAVLAATAVASEAAAKQAKAVVKAESKSDSLNKSAADGKKLCPTTAKGDCDGCPISAAVAKAEGKLPKISYKVGDESLHCPKSAASLAKKSDKPMQFVVAGKAYDNKDAATKALVIATEQFVADFAKPQVCKKSGTTTVAGEKQCCPDTAKQTASFVKAEMDKVNMSYVVGDKKLYCPVSAADLAKKTGKDKQFLVSTKDAKPTSCELTARLTLARAKYRAAVAALAKQKADAEAASKDSKIES